MDASAVGHGALTIAAGAAFAASGVALLGAVRGRTGWTRAAVALLTVAALAAALATAVLGRALVRLDLSLVYVADAARRSATRAYRLADSGPATPARCCCGPRCSPRSRARRAGRCGGGCLCWRRHTSRS